LAPLLLRRIKVDGDINSVENVEKVFGILMIFTACGMAFAHGSNDVANAVGPVAAVVSTVQSGGVIGAKVGHAVVGTGHWSGRYCRGPCYIRLASYPDHW
jgi:PiT family inorganic phosphate transporter